MKSFLQKITEETATKSPVVMAFGRMNPPTIGHEKLVNKVKELAHDYHAPHHIIISHTHDAKKNPLDAETKLRHAKRFFPNTNIITSDKTHPTFLQHAARLNHAGHDHLIMVAGSDRVDEYKNKLNQYNGTHGNSLFNYKRIDVKSAGQRDPDAEGAEGMSASKMREHARNNDFGSFKQGIPAHVPEHHAKELFRDVRRYMGIHEDVDYGKYKALFIFGGPGSGKDIIIREMVAHQNVVEMNTPLASSILSKLNENVKDYRCDVVRNRMPLIINSTTNETELVVEMKENLERLGYVTMMIFVDTSNEVSRIRNENHTKSISESVRFERWKQTRKSSTKLSEHFNKYLHFDNSVDLNQADDFQIAQKEEDITIITEMIDWFWSTPAKNVQIKDVSRLIESVKTCTCKYPRKSIFENICPSCQMVRKSGKIDSVNDGDVQSNSGYTFRTYEASPTISVKPEPKDPNFQQDADKIRSKKQRLNPNGAGKVLKPAGISPEYDTRGSGTVYPMSGLGQVTYREQKENKYNKKSFSKFRRESMDSPGDEMGVTGGYHGPSNKDPIDTLNKIDTTPTKKKNEKFQRIRR
jgi:predicted kinase